MKTTLTTNEKKLLELVSTAENPEQAIITFSELLLKILDATSPTSKIFNLICNNCTSFDSFVEATGLEGLRAYEIVSGEQEPTLDEVCKMAKALNRPEEEIALIFIG